MKTIKILYLLYFLNANNYIAFVIKNNYTNTVFFISKLTSCIMLDFNFDSTDKKIVKHLIKNARMKVVDIADYVGVTSAAIHQRIAKIKRSGLIKQYTLRLDEKKLGYTTCAFIGVFLDKNSQYSHIIETLKNINEIVEVHYTTGQYGLFAKVYCRDNDHLMKVLNAEIQQIDGVTRTETFISLDEPINRTISF